MKATGIAGIAVFGAALFLLGGSAEPAAAQGVEPPPYPEFTFRRVVPPGADHSGPRITIQITPEAFGAPAPGAAPTPVPNPDSTAADWFWSDVGSDLPPDPARYWAAQDRLAAAPETDSLNAPRLVTLNRLAEAHGRDLLMATIGTEVSPAFALAVMAVESHGRVEALSPAGAQGLMQLIPATAERFGVTDPLDPVQSITGGIAYLDWLMSEFDRDPILVLAAYNAGEGAVTRAGGVPEYDETRAYVPKVLATWMLARALCLTPPDLVSDGCVFQAMARN